jgi:hypothetical protein
MLTDLSERASTLRRQGKTVPRDPLWAETDAADRHVLQSAVSFVNNVFQLRQISLTKPKENATRRPFLFHSEDL